MPVGMIPVIMVLFGIGMSVGNLVGSKLADIALMGTIGGMLVFNIVVMTLFSLAAASPVMLCTSALMHSAFNIANAIGAWLGGLAIAFGYGYAATGYVGAFLSFIGLFVFAASVMLARRSNAIPGPMGCATQC
jgi:DHA1 family inner membrane transport protein